MNPMDDLLNHLLNAPKREVKMVYIATFRLPTFKPGEANGRDYITIARRDTRAEAQAALDASIAENSIGTVLMREGRKLHQYTQAGVYLGHWVISAQEAV